MVAARPSLCRIACSICSWALIVIRIHLLRAPRRIDGKTGAMVLPWSIRIQEGRRGVSRHMGRSWSTIVQTWMRNGGKAERGRVRGLHVLARPAGFSRGLAGLHLPLGRARLISILSINRFTASPSPEQHAGATHPRVSRVILLPTASGISTPISPASGVPTLEAMTCSSSHQAC